MDPNTPNHQMHATPPVPKTSFFARQLKGTSNAFVAEYSVFLLALGIVMGNLIWLIFIFCSLIVDSMNGGQAVTSYMSTPLFILWFTTSSLVSLPVVGVLWSRTQGELKNNPEFKGELPKGGAKGFRTFWIVVSVLFAIGLKIVAIYAPIAAALNGGNVVNGLLEGTLPALLAVGVLYGGVFMVTRSVDANKTMRLVLWVIVGATAVLFAADYIWASNIKKLEVTPPSYTTPTYPDYYDTVPSSY